MTAKAVSALPPRHECRGFPRIYDEAFSNIRQQSNHIQKLYHSVFELEELIEILIEELDDNALSVHHQAQKNRIKKQFILNSGQI